MNQVMKARWSAFTAGVTAAFLSLHILANQTTAQEPASISQTPTEAIKSSQAVQETRPSLAGYIDNEKGWIPGDAVAYALMHNAELQAARKEVEAARALVMQAGLRPNPSLSLEGMRLINGKDNTILAEGMLPLELGGRRAARVSVAERELEVRQAMVEDLERRLAVETRRTFGAALSAILKLGLTEDMLTSTRRTHRLVAGRVVEGRTAPLEENVVLVEVNRLRSLRETSKGRVEVALLELRNLMGINPEGLVRLRGNFTDLLIPPPPPLLPLTVATTRALATRPDLLAARAAERVAESQIELARATGRLDADLNAGYQRTNMGFPLNGITEAGQLRPIQEVFNSLTFGVRINVPVRNKNQGAVEAAVAQVEAAKRRREFLELTVRREVATAYTRYEHAARAVEIYRVGVRDQTAANLEVVSKTYELGAKTLLDYLDEQRRFIEVELAYIDTQLDSYLARVEIEGATASAELIQK